MAEQGESPFLKVQLKSAERLRYFFSAILCGLLLQACQPQKKEEAPPASPVDNGPEPKTFSWQAELYNSRSRLPDNKINFVVQGFAEVGWIFQGDCRSISNWQQITSNYANVLAPEPGSYRLAVQARLVEEAGPRFSECTELVGLWDPFAPALSLNPGQPPTRLKKFQKLDGTMLSGQCGEPQKKVSLSGDLQGEVLCREDKTFSLAITDSSEATATELNARLQHQDDLGNLAEIILRILRDNAEPITQLSQIPNAQNFGDTALLQFTASEPEVTFQCQWNEFAWQVCTSPLRLDPVNHGPHQMQIRSVDLAGNEELVPQLVRWNQWNDPILLLQDFSRDLVTDSSSYQALSDGKRPIVDGVSIDSALGAAVFQKDKPSFIERPHDDRYQLLKNTMEIRARLALTSPISTAGFRFLASKSGSTGQLGWYVGLRRVGRNDRLMFALSFDGRLMQYFESDNVVMPETGSMMNLTYRFSSNRIEFYFNDKLVTTRSLSQEFSGREIFQNRAPLRLGRNEIMGGQSLYWDFALDELAISWK